MYDKTMEIFKPTLSPLQEILERLPFYRIY